VSSGEIKTADSIFDSRFQFHKRSQLFIRATNETPSVVALRVSNEDRPPARKSACDEIQEYAVNFGTSVHSLFIGA
jgi:hypothetical protein